MWVSDTCSSWRIRQPYKDIHTFLCFFYLPIQEGCTGHSLVACFRGSEFTGGVSEWEQHREREIEREHHEGKGGEGI